MRKAAPKGLRPLGRRMWRDVTGLYTLRPDELRLLEEACREMDLIERLDAELVDAPLMVKGSMGQVVASPLVQELRQHRAILARLFAALRLPDEGADGAAADDRSQAGRNLIAMRWGRRGA